MKYHTTAAYISGGLCGRIWWPVGELCGKPMRHNLRDFMREGEGYTFRDALLNLQMSEGGDFQSASFTADTVLRVERVAIENGIRNMRYVHVWEREISQLPDCDDLVNADAFVSDFMGED